MKKIKLAHIINYMSPAGKEIGIVKLLNKLDPGQFESTLIVTDKVYDLLNLDTSKTRLIELNKKKGNDFSLPYKLYKLFKKEKFHIVHTHAWGTLVEGVLAAKSAGVPVVIHGEHGTFHKDFKRKIIQKVFYKWADYLMSVSDVLAKEIAQTIGINENKFHTILNGVDVDRFAPNPLKRAAYREELGFKETDFILGTVGRPNPVKNHSLIIHALKEIVSKFSHAHVIIIGDSPLDSQRDAMQALAKDLDVADHVHFLGTKEDIPGYLNTFDTFLLPSLREGCSNVLQEAMATGLPIVASNVGGNPELITHGKTGLLFNVQDINEFIGQIMQFIEHPELKTQFGARAREQAVTNFSLPTMIKSYSEYYKELVGKIK